uniref:Vitellogenin-1 n=1 Tax=Pardosa pseudoannulata TaxID=330961 RepID=A0A346FLJ0_9ARAC|nr:vitellogenin-1 [Pardosa pseudoannulata]
MRFLILVALLILAVAEAHHTPEHTLRGPRFSIGNLHIYDVELNVTSGIWGLSDQASKSAFQAELHIYAKNEKEHILRLKKVYTSGSVEAADGIDEDVPLRKNRELEERLASPIKFTMENGEITSYTLSPNDNLESRKIKKSILRSLEMFIPDYAHEQLESNSRTKIPVTYNITQNNGLGEHTTYYLITVSPNVEFPYHTNVYNISRSDDFEGDQYPSYKFYHNFESQGCPHICRKDMDDEDDYESDCPSGYEPYQSPMNTYVHYQHHLTLENGVMTPEIIESREVHVAKMYDQDMNVLIKMNIRKTGFTKRTIEEPQGQTYTDLNDQEPEINKLEIEEQCGYKSSREAMEVAKTLLHEIAQIIVRGDLENTQSTMMGEKIILLKKALAKLEVSELQTIAGEIKRLGSLSSASEEEKVMRQIWMDMLPTVGTENAVTFIVKYIKENLGRELLVWEAKEILEALPQNINNPSEKNIKELRTLLQLSKVKSHHLLHSAVYSCLGRVIGDICNGTETERNYMWAHQSSQRRQSSHRPQSSHRRQSSQRQHSSSSSHNDIDVPEDCPVQLVQDIVKEITDKLRSTREKGEIVIYLETLAVIGVPEVLPIISEYAYGTAENMQQFTPSYYEFVKTASVYSLHRMVVKHPDMVLEIVSPLFFNETETPQLRNAAFGVLIRCQPSKEVLQHIAILTWKEQSNEVGSYVTSTLDTFGNATLPCFMSFARRIQEVMPMVNRFDIGIQHAKNILWSYFDDVREFGLKGHISYTPNNESIVPSAMFHSLSYATDSLADTLIQGALHIQGLTQKRIIDYIDRTILGISPPEVISSSKDHEIFEEAKLVERIPEEMRLTIYRKMFYSSAFYYLDLQNIKTQVDVLKDYLRAYLTKTSYDYSGHLVKVYLPSYFHTETIAKTLPYPVEFQMFHPVVLALKVESLARNPTLANFHFFIKPSVYVSKLFLHHLKNVGDCKDIGVYHENKIAVTYPLEVKFAYRNLKNIVVSYKVRELPKRILYYFSEAGTYAGKRSFRMLPSSENREPIRTIPAPFQHTPEINIVGVPPMRINVHTEDIDLMTTMTPDTPFEVLDIAVQCMMNAGWRYKAMNVTMKVDSSEWPKDTEVTFKLQYDRTHVTTERARMNSQRQASWSVRQSEDDDWMTTEQPESDEDDRYNTESAPQSWAWAWKRDSKDTDDEDNGDDWSQGWSSESIRSKRSSTFIDKAKKGVFKVQDRAHVNHELNLEIETKPVRSNAHIRMEYNHTYSKSLYSIFLDAAMKTPKDRVTRRLNLIHVMEYFDKIDEFQYDAHKDEHKAIFISALRTASQDIEDPWKDVDIVVAGKLFYETLDNLLNKELQYKVDRKYFLPETHEECIQDVRDGHALSENCIKALRERSIFNKIRMSLLWNKDLPPSVKYVAKRLDTFLKHIYYNQMRIKDEKNTEKKIYMTLDHINKLTDKPVFDVTIQKPEETIEFRRLKTLGYGLDDPLSSVHDVLGVDSMVLTNNTYPPSCVMMKKYVRTFDLVSYPIKLDRCNYVLSAHCSNYKNFAITTKILSPEEGTKEIHIYVGPHTIILTPKKGQEYTVKYDGRDYTIADAMVFDENTAEIYVFIEKFQSNHKHIKVVAKRAGITVNYDGWNVEVKVDPRYKGETCGLCSEFDGEQVREFRGLDRCLYSHHEDFVNSAITNRDTCRKQPVYPYMCENEESNSQVAWRRGSASREYEPTLRRNIVIVKGNEICFSVRPVPVCEDNVRPVQTRREQISFHCLPRSDITARRMVSEAKRRVLGEVENKSVDYEEEVEIPTMCSE